MTRQEWQIIALISSIVSLRLLGIFLVLPVFSIYAIRYPGATGALAGLAFGIYALVQAILQLPLGYLSDRFGRKPILILGLILFSIGSFFCARATTIEGLIIARALQGAGAVGAVALAALGDMTRPTIRARAFTLMGISIGIAFTIGIISGPVLASNLGFEHLFDILSAFGLMACLITMFFLPGKPSSLREGEPEADFVSLSQIFTMKTIRRILIAAFLLSYTLNTFFFIYPLEWHRIGTDEGQLWKVYLIIFLPAAVIVFPLVRKMEIQGKLKIPIVLGWTTLMCSLVLFLFGHTKSGALYLSGALFFLGYSMFQPLLPAFLTQEVGPQSRGRATGAYNLSGFLGASAGGILGGVLYHYHPAVPIVVSASLILIWLFLGLPVPPQNTM